MWSEEVETNENKGKLPFLLQSQMMQADMWNLLFRQTGRQTDRHLNSHFTCCCQRPLCELWVRENLQQRKRKQRPPKILHCWFLPHETVQTDLVWKKTGGPPKGKQRWSRKPILTPRLNLTHLQQQQATRSLCSPSKPTRKLPRRGSLRSNQVAFNHYFTVSQSAVVK